MSQTPTILITGASKGFGYAIAEAFAKQGYNLLLSSRSDMALYKAMETLITRFPNNEIRGKHFDLSTRAGVDGLAAWVKETGIVPDILVNNAGVFLPGSVHNEPENTLETMLNVNLFSAYHLTRALVGEMMQRGSGHIFNMCSIASLHAYSNGGAYSISKFALLGFSKNLREEMKPHGIKVTHVIPGAAFTASWEGSGVDPERIMEAADIAQMMVAAAALSPQACVEEIVLRPQLGDL